MKRSTVPSLLDGHISSDSLFQVRSPMCTVLNRPNEKCVPTDCAFSEGSGSLGLYAPQYGFLPPAPGTGLAMNCPAAATMRASTPLSSTRSPGLAIVCFELAYNFGYTSFRKASVAAAGCTLGPWS